MASIPDKKAAADAAAAEKAVADAAAAEKAAAEQPEIAADEGDSGIVEEAKAVGRKIEDELEELGIKIEAEGHAVVKLLVSLAGEVVKAPGDPHSCSPEEAVRMVRAGFAKPSA